MNVLAIIPARGGSKGIKQKNLRKINGVSLVNHAVTCARTAANVTDILISTDCDKIINEVKKMGIHTPFKRPEALSGDRIADIEVLIHAVTEYEKFSRKTIDVIVMLQPTSPLRTPKMVDDCINKLLKDSLDSVWTASAVELKHHPLKQLIVNQETQLCSLYDAKGSNIIARQQLSETYIRNGACYVFTRDCILKEKTIYGKNMKLNVIEEFQVSIDTLQDLAAARRALRNL